MQVMALIPPPPRCSSSPGLSRRSRSGGKVPS